MNWETRIPSPAKMDEAMNTADAEKETALRGALVSKGPPHSDMKGISTGMTTLSGSIAGEPYSVGHDATSHRNPKSSGKAAAPKKWPCCLSMSVAERLWNPQPH